MEMNAGRLVLLAVFLSALALACSQSAQPGAGQIPSPAPSPICLNPGRTQFGFFPAPPRDGVEAVQAHFQDLGKYADFILVQASVPWQDFSLQIEADSQSRRDLRNQILLADQNGLGAVFVVDPLNGLNRREFLGLPPGWIASFANPEIRTAYLNFTLWLLRTFQPQYLGLASEINTYADAHPQDFPHFLSLYQETYARIKPNHRKPWFSSHSSGRT
jgi:hypothetical protein